MTFLMMLMLLVSQSADQPLADEASEDRARALMKEIRCLVCQNQSIEDSNALIATDLRRFVRERIDAGDSNQMIKDALVDRYGDWVLLAPPFDSRTLILWGSPLVLLLSGGVWFLTRQRRASAGQSSVPLSAEEQAQLNALLSDRDDRP